MEDELAKMAAPQQQPGGGEEAAKAEAAKAKHQMEMQILQGELEMAKAENAAPHCNRVIARYVNLMFDWQFSIPLKEPSCLSLIVVHSPGIGLIPAVNNHVSIRHIEFFVCSVCV